MARMSNVGSKLSPSRASRAMRNYLALSLGNVSWTVSSFIVAIMSAQYHQVSTLIVLLSSMPLSNSLTRDTPKALGLSA